MFYLFVIGCNIKTVPGLETGVGLSSIDRRGEIGTNNFPHQIGGLDAGDFQAIAEL